MYLLIYLEYCHLRIIQDYHHFCFYLFETLYCLLRKTGSLEMCNQFEYLIKITKSLNFIPNSINIKVPNSFKGDLDIAEVDHLTYQRVCQKILLV